MTIEGVDITPGSGKSIAVDTVNVGGGNKEFQILKIALGAEDAFDLVVDSGQQTMANSLPITMASDQLPIVVGKKLKNIALTPTISTSVYVAGYCVGGKLTLTDAMRASGASGLWHSLHIIDRGNQKAALVIQIYNANPTAATLTDHTTVAYSTDLGKVIATVLVTAADYNSAGGISFADIIIDHAVAASGSAHLYASATCVGVPDYVTTTDLTYDFGFIQW